jgi:hypothetical protein
VRKSVTVVSSDAKNANFPLQFAAIVGSTPPTVGLVPETGVDFDRFAADESREARVAVTNFSPTAVAIQIVGAPPAYLEARLSSARLEPKQSADLIVKTLANGVPLGKFSGAVTLVMEGQQTTRLTIPVSGVSMMK